LGPGQQQLFQVGQLLGAQLFVRPGLAAALAGRPARLVPGAFSSRGPWRRRPPVRRRPHRRVCPLGTGRLRPCVAAPSAPLNSAFS
jgi:hypothetical protein